MLTKQAWRRRSELARHTIDVEPGRHLEALSRFLADAPPGWIVLYSAFDGEIDVAPLTERSGLGPFALTRTPEEGHDLTVHPFGSPRERHRYGYDQPTADSQLIDDSDIAVVLVPGMAFDRLGARLGRGKGYYDRFLARLGAETLLVGITGGYVVAELPVDAHDVAMTHLASGFGVLPVPLADPE